MKKTILLFGVFLASYTFAQVSISPVSTDTPQATLDVKAMTKTGSAVEGILIPRVTRAKAAAMTDVVESTMIYVSDNNTTAGTGTVTAVDTKGFYYFDATAAPAPGKWVKVGDVKEETFTRNVRSDNRATVVVDQLQDGTTATKDYFIRMTGTVGDITFPAATASNKGRTICLYSENGGSGTITPQPIGPVQTVQASQVACFISDGATWINSNGY